MSLNINNISSDFSEPMNLENLNLFSSMYSEKKVVSIKISNPDMFEAKLSYVRWQDVRGNVQDRTPIVELLNTNRNLALQIYDLHTLFLDYTKQPSIPILYPIKFTSTVLQGGDLTIQSDYYNEINTSTLHFSAEYNAGRDTSLLFYNAKRVFFDYYNRSNKNFVTKMLNTIYTEILFNVKKIVLRHIEITGNGKQPVTLRVKAVGNFINNNVDNMNLQDKLCNFSESYTKEKYIQITYNNSKNNAATRLYFSTWDDDPDMLESEKSYEILSDTYTVYYYNLSSFTVKNMTTLTFTTNIMDSEPVKLGVDAKNVALNRDKFSFPNTGSREVMLKFRGVFSAQISVFYRDGKSVDHMVNETDDELRCKNLDYFRVNYLFPAADMDPKLDSFLTVGKNTSNIVVQKKKFYFMATHYAKDKVVMLVLNNNIHISNFKIIYNSWTQQENYNHTDVINLISSPTYYFYNLFSFYIEYESDSKLSFGIYSLPNYTKFLKDDTRNIGITQNIMKYEFDVKYTQYLFLKIVFNDIVEANFSVVPHNTEDKNMYRNEVYNAVRKSIDIYNCKTMVINHIRMGRQNPSFKTVIEKDFDKKPNLVVPANVDLIFDKKNKSTFYFNKHYPTPHIMEYIIHNQFTEHKLVILITDFNDKRIKYEIGPGVKIGKIYWNVKKLKICLAATGEHPPVKPPPVKSPLVVNSIFNKLNTSNINQSIELKFNEFNYIAFIFEENFPKDKVVLSITNAYSAEHHIYLFFILENYSYFTKSVKSSITNSFHDIDNVIAIIAFVKTPLRPFKKSIIKFFSLCY
jgi:hypothetical protein